MADAPDGAWDPGEGPFRERVVAINFVADAGKQLLESSTSISEVLERLHQVLPAVGLGGCSVDATMSSLILSYWQPDQVVPLTAMRELDISSPRLELLTATDALLGDVESGAVGLKEAAERLEGLEAADPPRELYTRLAALGAVVGWVLFLQGADLLTVLVALAATALTFPVDTLVRRLGLPTPTSTFLVALIVAVVPNLAAGLGVSLAVGPAVVGALYIYLPGRALVSAVIDGLGNAPLSALARGTEALGTASFLALGMLVGSRIGQWFDVGSPAEVSPPEVLAIIGAGIGVAGVALSWAMPRAQLLPAAAIGTVGWVIVELGPTSAGSNWLGYALAAGVVGVAGSLVGQFQGAPPSAYTGVAILPLVPGYTLYFGMSALAQGQTDAAMSSLSTAGVLSLAIALGVAIGLSIGRNAMAVGRRARPAS